MTDDLRPLGAGAAIGHYWIKQQASIGAPYLRLAAVDGDGNVKLLPPRAPFDPAAPDRAEAVRTHLASVISEADRHLERRREPPPEEPKPLDPGTDRFLDDEDLLDLN